MASSVSVTEVIRRLGKNPRGGLHGHITGIIRHLGIDTSHHTGQGSNRGEHHKGGPDRVPPEVILTLDRNGGRRENVERLRWALLAVGVEEKCGECDQGEIWNGKPLRLQIDHRNGNPVDNRRGNLRFLCPNCHTQTENFGVLNTAPRK